MAAADLAQLPAIDLAPAGAAPGSSRVLLVEDDVTSLKILKKRIVNAGYAVETAIDGVDGLEKFERFHPHLVISDWMMPRMDGRELCEAIKRSERNASTYFILLTARDKHEDIVKALDTGADEYLIKPCDGPELMARLRAAERLLQLRSALALSNDKLKSANDRINKELRDISAIQRALLPQSLPQTAGYRFGAHYQPSTECSGDFYDVLELDEGRRLGIVVGDVSGHGAASMVAMAVLRMLYRSESQATLDPAEVLASINRKMYECLPTDQYATMFYGVLDRATGRMTYSSGGHPPPLLVSHATGSARYLEGCEGFPIKLVGPKADYSNSEMTIPANHTLLFYTDGLTEAFNPQDELFGMERLCETVSRWASAGKDKLIAEILGAVDDFRQDRPLSDDLSLLVVGRE